MSTQPERFDTVVRAFPARPRQGRPTPAFADPAPDSIIFTNVRLRDDIDQATVSRFGDDDWYLFPMADKTTVTDLKIAFETVPEPFRAAAKRLVLALINQETPVDLLERFTAVRTRVSAGTITASFNDDIRLWLRWLEERGVSRFCDVTDELQREYANHIVSKATVRERKGRILFSITRVWLMSPYLPPADRLPQPPWEREDADERDTLDALIGPSEWTAENSTQPIHPQTMSALLMCCMTLIEECSQDITDALVLKKELLATYRKKAAPGDRSVVTDYIQGLIDGGNPLPGTWGRRSGADTTVIAKQYIGATLGVGYNALDRLNQSGLNVQFGAPLPSPIRGRIDGAPWTEAIDHYEAEDLARHLATACYIVTGYLSGLRVEECRALEQGKCLPVEPAPGEPAHYQLFGKTFKDVTDEHGNTIAGGAERPEPWTVIEPVAVAIALAETLSASDLVFPHAIFTRSLDEQKASERSVSTVALGAAIANLIEWWNNLAHERGLDHYAIPPDPEGQVSARRFRRTLAWFIYRLPAGRIALGIHYGHVKGITTIGYGSRVQSGLRDVFPMEEAFAMSDHLNEAADRLDAGESVSGPAADRYIAGVRKYQKTFGGAWLTPRQAAELTRDPELRIYDNGYQPLACVFNQATAACRTERDRTANPDLTRTPDASRCQKHCANIAMTDHHADEMHDEITARIAEIESPLTPEPMRHRLAQQIENLNDALATHEATKRIG